MNPWTLYAIQRRLGLRRPPSVASWTRADSWRQVRASRRIEQQCHEALGELPKPASLPWEPHR